MAFLDQPSSATICSLVKAVLEVRIRRPLRLPNLGLTSQWEMGPSVDGNLVAFHVFVLEHVGARNDTRADDEKGRLELGGVHVVQERRRIRAWSIVVAVLLFTSDT
jgi:hypothetical protein